MLVHWDGWEDDYRPKWEPLEAMREDFTELVKYLLHSPTRRRLNEKILGLLYGGPSSKIMGRCGT